MQAEQKKSGVSIGNWMLTQLLLVIPIVNLILLVVWSITAKNRSKRNFCIASLIWIVILAVLFVLSAMFFGPQITDWLRSLGQSL